MSEYFNVKKLKFFLILIILAGVSFNTMSTNQAEGATALANLVFKTQGGGTRPDYALYIAQYLRDIGIEVEVKVEEWSVFVGTLLLTHDYDMGVMGLTCGTSPDLRSIYTQEGSLNMFLLDRDMPYGNLSETMQNEAVTITDLYERQQLYFEWQELMMDRIVPMLPMYSPKSYVGLWANTIGYDGRWDLVNSLPYMEYDGYHEGQVSLNEFNLADANWRELNPLFCDDSSSELIFDFVSEPLLHFDPELCPTETGLIQGWEKIDDFHYKFNLRDNIYWNPSYDVRARTAKSDPLTSIPEEEFMVGLKNGEYSNGTNQKVTAKDAVFTILCWANRVISEETVEHKWVSDCYVDPEDSLAFHVHIDGDPETPEQEYYTDFWSTLNIGILPEFFLNSSSTELTLTEGGVECQGLYYGIESAPQWLAYSTSAFGCGKYILDYAVENSVTVLQKNPNWFGVGAIDGTEQDLDIQTINVRVIPDTSAELAEFKAGKLDLTTLTHFPDERHLMQSDVRFNIVEILRNYMLFMFFNLQRPFVGGAWNYEFLKSDGEEIYTKGAGIRKAMCYAIDREKINRILHDGEYFITNSVISPFLSFYYYEDIIKYNYNLDDSLKWLRASLGLIDWSLDVYNPGGYGNDIIIRFVVNSNDDVSDVILFFNVNNEGYNSTLMHRDSTMTYSTNIGSSFTNGTRIQYYIRYTNDEGIVRSTSKYTILVIRYIETDNSFQSLNAPMLFSLSFILIAFCTFVIARRVRKKRKF